MPSLDLINKVLFYFSVLHFSVERSGQQKNVGQKNVRLVPSCSRTFWFTLQVLSAIAEATLLMRSSKKVPGDRDMRAIPRWARVALAARTLRRVQPLLLVSWPKATRKFQRAVEWAIAEGESAATQGSPTPDMQDAGSAAVKVLGDRPMNAVTAYYLAAAASGVSFSGKLLNASRAQYALEQARLAVYFFDEDHDAPCNSAFSFSRSTSFDCAWALAPTDKTANRKITHLNIALAPLVSARRRRAAWSSQRRQV
jgi:hypothetical protein